VQSAYVDLRGRRRRAGRAELIAVLRALGAPVEGPADVPGALRERREELARRLLEPVAVACAGAPARVDLRAPARRTPERVACRLELEDGSARTWTPDPATLPTGDRCFELALPEPLPLGYHRLEVEVDRRTATTLVIRAPSGVADPLPAGCWGLFAPVHALHRSGGWGVGDLTDLGELLGWVGELGGSLVGTLPLFATFLEPPADPSPYAPVSRRFWNELFLDVEALPDVRGKARDLVRSPALRAELAALSSGELVDHARAMAAKRRVLELAARELDGARRDALDAHARERPDLEDYARFRAAGERWGRDWRVWPGPARDGRLEAADVDPAIVGYHRYVQWATEEQLASVAAGGGLYLDLPLGVHPDGYDAWRDRDAFALGVSVGAPPDAFFEAGQDWGTPPPHPDRLREQGYRYPIGCLRRSMRLAGALRIDHAMGLHRLYWVPHGFPADRGVYVRSRPEEWYAIVCLESHRAGTAVVGEDLGTVPPGVRAALRRHGILRSHVLQMEADPDRRPPFPPPPARSLASLNTHDTAPFAAFWRGLDVDRRIAFGLLDAAGAEAERARRARLRGAVIAHLRSTRHLAEGREDEAAVLEACLAALASSPARVVIVSLEDLWGETRPQNLPGVPEPANWRGRMAHPLEAARGMPEVADRLRRVASLRRATAPIGQADGRTVRGS